MADDWKLPAGWFVAHAEDGEAYFYNETTGETSWDPPAGSFPKVAPAGAGASDQAAAAQDDSDDDWDVDDDDDDDDEQQQGTPQGRARRESAFDRMLAERQADGTTQFAASMEALRDQGVFGNRTMQQAIEERSTRAFKNRKKSQFATSIRKLMPKLRAAGQFTPDREEHEARPMTQVPSPSVDQAPLGSVSNRMQSLSIGGMDTNVAAPRVGAVHGDTPTDVSGSHVGYTDNTGAMPAQAAGEMPDSYYVNDDAADLLFGGGGPPSPAEAATELGWSPAAGTAESYVNDDAADLLFGGCGPPSPAEAATELGWSPAAGTAEAAAEEEEEDEPTHGWEPVEYQVVSFICYEYTDPATGGLVPVELPLFGSAGSLELGLAVVAFEGLVLLGPRDEDEPVVIPYDKMLFWTVTTNFGPSMSDHFVDMTMDATYDPSMDPSITWWTGHVLELRGCLADEATATAFSASLKAVCERVREVGLHQVDTSGMKNSRVARASIMSGKPSITAGMSARQRRATITEMVQREDRMAQGFVSDDLGSLLGGGPGGGGGGGNSLLGAAPDGQGMPGQPTKKKFSMRRALGLRRHSKHDFEPL